MYRGADDDLRRGDSSYSYHIVDCLMPPSIKEERGLLLNLQNQCVRTIVKDITLNCQLLSNTPLSFHKIIWQAYLREQYYKHRNDGTKDHWFICKEKKKILPEISELLYHWPQEVFNLNDVMPKFSSTYNSLFTSFQLDESPYISPYDENEKYLMEFHKCVAVKIVDTFTTNYESKTTELHKSKLKLKKINVSGFHLFLLPGMYENFKWYSVQCPILDRIGKIELIIDASFHSIGVTGSILSRNKELYHSHGPIQFDFDGKEAESKPEVIPCCASSSNSVYLKFVDVKLNFYLIKKERKAELIKTLVTNGTKSISLNPGYGEIYEFLGNKLENNGNQNITGLSIKLDSHELYIPRNFLNEFANLIHLNLGSINLRNHLGFLRNMHVGLVFLCLHNCGLLDIDLDNLIGSCHESTLQELDLSLNTKIGSVHRRDNSNTNLGKLCKKLTNIKKLNLSRCYLKSWPSMKIKFLCKALKRLPNIVYLNLGYTQFINDALVHVTELSECESLRYLILGYPNGIYEDNDYLLLPDKPQNDPMLKEYQSHFNATMNTNRSELLYIEFTEFSWRKYDSNGYLFIKEN